MNKSVYAARRRKFAHLMAADSVAVFAAASEKMRSNDTQYPYRQNSDFYYFSGFEEDNACICIVKEKMKSSVIFFVQPKDEKLELWTGKRLGVEAAQLQFDVDAVFSVEQFETQMQTFLQEKTTLYFDLFSAEPLYDNVRKIAATLRHTGSVKRSVRSFKDATLLSGKMRLVKGAEELTLIKQAVAITKAAHHHAMRLCKPGILESALQAEYVYHFHIAGAHSEAYTTIVAGADRANTLHYIKNDQKLEADSLVLVDAGCEFQMYASDITRTFPVSGRFTTEQKNLYEMVLFVQLKVIEAIKPGTTKAALQHLAEVLLCEGMITLGILEGERDSLIKTKAHKKYFPHGIGHWMGLDVHDPLPYVDEEGDAIAFEAGMVLTVEPGIYIRADDEEAPEAYRGIGIRIEDNILVTEDGCENLSTNIAKTVAEIEAQCASKNTKIT